MFKSYLMLADKRLKRNKAIVWDKKEDAINNLYQEGVAMAMVFSEEVYLCVTDLDKSTGTAIYQISKDGTIQQISLAS